jgi:hypothetical protein
MNDFSVVYEWRIESYEGYFKKNQKENKKYKRGCLFSKVFGGKYEATLSSE